MQLSVGRQRQAKELASEQASMPTGRKPSSQQASHINWLSGKPAGTQKDMPKS
ncbi:MAG: hypothetical protein LBJ10_06705 [Clostridiales bacterium]|jgi:hypothetical protein|nr:hypothetical protein [Clostridiales bacterium]